MGRCKATNLCPYCARIMAVETVELLMLDALEWAPTLYVVLTARELLDRADCRDHLRQLRRSLRKRWPGIEWACLVEFQRRGALHLNLLVKGVPVEDLEELRHRICGIWTRRVDAEPQAQFVGEITAAGGLIRYVAAHFLKPGQAPPLGWRGHRSSYTGGYLVASAAVMRRRAREALQLKRELWKAIASGASPHDAELQAREAAELQARSVWTLATDRGARIGSSAHRPELQAAALGRTRLHENELVRLLVVELDAREEVDHGNREATSSCTTSSSTPRGVARGQVPITLEAGAPSSRPGATPTPTEAPLRGCVRAPECDP